MQPTNVIDYGVTELFTWKNECNENRPVFVLSKNNPKLLIYDFASRVWLNGDGKHQNLLVEMLFEWRSGNMWWCSDLVWFRSVNI